MAAIHVNIIQHLQRVNVCSISYLAGFVNAAYLLKGQTRNFICAGIKLLITTNLDFVRAVRARVA